VGGSCCRKVENQSSMISIAPAKQLSTNSPIKIPPPIPPPSPAFKNMSRPTTPLGFSPRGSFANLAEPAPGTPRDEKERLRAEMEMHARVKADDEEKAKKEEVGMSVACPGESLDHYNG